jgi:hypothetical protein
VTAAERDKAFAEMEAEYGLTARPGEDMDTRAARLQTAIRERVDQKKVNAYRQELKALGAIHDPSPEEEKFLQAHRHELPNLVITRSQPDVDVELIGWPLKDYVAVESCELRGSVLRCLIKVKPGYPLEGWRLSAKSSRWNGVEFVDLGGTSVTAPHLMGGGTSELTILLPGRVDMVFLSYR